MVGAVRYPFQDTIPRQFLAAAELYNKANAFRVKRDGRYHDVGHREVREKVHALACALAALNLERGDRVALLSENRMEWAIADLAMLSVGLVNVPVYATLPPNQVEYILRDSDARGIFVSSRAQLAKVDEIRSRLPLLEHVFAFEADASRGNVASFDALLASGLPLASASDYGAMIGAVSATDLASIIYTSGTTGEPKGVILTHANFMANVRQCLAVFELGPDDTSLSFLPLSHVFERTAGFFVMMTAGMTIAYAESIETVPENLLEVRPTVVCSVPRVYEKMYSRIVDAVAHSPAPRRALFHWAIGVGRRRVSEHLAGRVRAWTALQARMAHALVFKKIQARVGGRLRFFVSGSAPLDREIAEFFYAAGLPVLEGYGLTETSPVLSVNVLQAFKFGTVGKPLPEVEIRIAEDGEILARGPNVMQGYFKKPVETAEAIVDGWFRTGDIGHLDADGFLVITDRKKDLIATAGGKKMAPQPVEAKLKRDPFVAEAVLVGNRRPFIALLIVPNFGRLAAWAKAGGIAAANQADLLAAPAVRALYQKVVDDVNADMASFERIKSFVLLERDLSIADGELTPTLKVKRTVVEEKYRDLIETMYAPRPPR